MDNLTTTARYYLHQEQKWWYIKVQVKEFLGPHMMNPDGKLDQQWNIIDSKKPISPKQEQTLPLTQ